MILGLSGFSKVGKDCAALGMSNFRRFAFADSLKHDVQMLLDNLNMDLNVHNPTVKEIIRPLLVEWGRTARKFQPDFWIKRMVSAMTGWLEDRPTANTVVTDVRYPNEVQAILDLGGKVVRIHRDGFGPANEEEAESIMQIDLHFRLPSVRNDGSPKQLVDKIMFEIGFKL